MKRSGILRVIVLVISLSLFCSSFYNRFLAKNVSGNYSNAGFSSTDATTSKLVVTSFKDFEIYNDDSNISSVNTNDAIFFSYSGGANYGPIIENYILRLDNWGNCTDFEFYGSFTYSLTDVDDMLSFRMITGSYYTHSGEYIGLPDRPGNEVFLSSIGVNDPWAGTIGYHVMYVYPFDVKVIHHDDYGSIGYNGNLQIKAIRKNNALTCQLINLENDNLIFNETYSSGVNKPINYLFLDFYTGNSYSIATVNAYEINATLYFKSNNTVKINVPLPYAMATISIAVLVLISKRSYRKQKKR